MQNVLIVEDEQSIIRVLKKILYDEFKFNIYEASDGTSAINLISKKKFELILCDIKMPNKNGIDVLEFCTKNSPDVPVVMISGHGDLPTAVKAMRLGAYDYISKPPDLNHLFKTIKSALNKKHYTRTINKKTLDKKYQMIGKSKALVDIQNMIDKVAPTMARVFIQGPNGSGKELVARALHSRSDRSDGPFIEVNCAAIPNDLIESELFGHVKGSFTSAIKDRTGTFQQANGGTLFLDEIGDMTLSAQAKVLRALEEHKIQRVGDNKYINIDVRVLAATNKNIIDEISHKRFREDLYHRLCVIEINVPGLNDRPEDIPLLAEYFINRLKPKKYLTKKALNSLTMCNWSGNVRQLNNFIERLHILCENEINDVDVKKYFKTTV